MQPQVDTGTFLKDLTLKLGGDPMSPEPVVLSCGGIFLPRGLPPPHMRGWRQIVNLPGEELTARIFALSPFDPKRQFELIIEMERLN